VTVKGEVTVRSNKGKLSTLTSFEAFNFLLAIVTGRDNFSMGLLKDFGLSGRVTAPPDNPMGR
jgi:hypothetical protein